MVAPGKSNLLSTFPLILTVVCLWAK